MPVGTVVDLDITGKDQYDFYMVPHHGLKGTCRPSHYHVINDDAHLEPDQLQQFTFE